MPPDPQRIWQELSSNATGHGWAIKRFDPDAKVGLLLGVHHPERQPSILIELHSGGSDELRDWPATQGVDVGPDKWGDTAGIRLTLIDQSLLAVFSVLVCDLVPLAAGPHPATRVRARLEAWLSLLSRRRQQGLDNVATLALLSELEILRNLARHIAVPDVINAWEGPQEDSGSGRGLHDFRLKRARIEVKSTSRVPVSSVGISRHAQLDPDVIGNDALLLVVVSWSSPTTSGQSLPALIKEIRQIISPHPLAAGEFEDKLLSAGWHDSDAPLYERRSWVMLDTRWYHVVDDFPRLVCRSLPAGILDGEYSISVPACEKWRISAEQAMQISARNPS